MPSTGTHDYQPAREVTVTTVGNIDDLDFDGASIIRMNNATLSTIRGLKAGYAGQKVTVISIGAGEVDFAHQNVNSSAVNRLINFVTSGATPLAAGVGVADYQYDNTTQRWRLINHNQGAFITPAFAAGDWTGSGLLTVTVAAGDITTDAYLLIGRVLHVSLVLSGISTGGVASTDIRRAIPAGFISTREHRAATYRVSDNGTIGTGITIVEPGGLVIRVLKIDISNWNAASANNTAIQGQVFFDVD